MRNLPHLDFGLLKAVGHKVDVLKSCDDAFLFGCYFGVEGHYPCVTRERMLQPRNTGVKNGFKLSDEPQTGLRFVVVLP